MILYCLTCGKNEDQTTPLDVTLYKEKGRIFKILMHLFYSVMKGGLCFTLHYDTVPHLQKQTNKKKNGLNTLIKIQTMVKENLKYLKISSLEKI